MRAELVYRRLPPRVKAAIQRQEYSNERPGPQPGAVERLARQLALLWRLEGGEMDFNGGSWEIRPLVLWQEVCGLTREDGSNTPPIEFNADAKYWGVTHIVYWRARELYAGAERSP